MYTDHDQFGISDEMMMSQMMTSNWFRGIACIQKDIGTKLKKKKY